ncbi:MAG: hypothetical protein N2Z57_00885 [Oscillospiraceae bacterium]|nr:hypothetical protein [Oscillospiraceae bacterium]
MKEDNKNKNNKAEKSAGNNQWSAKSQKPASPERRDGPGGENRK